MRWLVYVVVLWILAVLFAGAARSATPKPWAISKYVAYAYNAQLVGTKYHVTHAHCVREGAARIRLWGCWLRIRTPHGRACEAELLKFDAAYGSARLYEPPVAINCKTGKLL